MGIEAIRGNTPYSSSEAAQNAQGDKEITTVTTHCDKKHSHDKSCPHTVSTKPSPKVGENGYYLDKLA